MAGLVSTVASAIGISAQSARRIAKSAHHRYKVFAITKPSGGVRMVAQPAREVKALQRAMVVQLAESLPVHSAATAYKKGASIASNAAAHVGARFLTKLDFKDFFPSITADAISRHLQQYDGAKLTSAEIDFVTALSTWVGSHGNRCLCIGAPSSPFLANSVMYDFDASVSEHCSRRGVTYTRYSDDIALSALQPNILQDVEAEIYRCAAEMDYPRLEFNVAKRRAVSRKTGFYVTGLVLTNQGAVSVGRLRKRGVRAGVDRYIRGLLDEPDLERLRGELAFVLSVEPQFRNVLVSTYGNVVLAILPRE